MIGSPHRSAPSAPSPSARAAGRTAAGRRQEASVGRRARCRGTGAGMPPRWGGAGRPPAGPGRAAECGRATATRAGRRAGAGWGRTEDPIGQASRGLATGHCRAFRRSRPCTHLRRAVMVICTPDRPRRPTVVAGHSPACSRRVWYHRTRRRFSGLLGWLLATLERSAEIGRLWDGGCGSGNGKGPPPIGPEGGGRGTPTNLGCGHDDPVARAGARPGLAAVSLRAPRQPPCSW